MEPDRPSSEKQPGAGGLARALKYMHLAFVIPFSLAVGIILGSFMDRWLGTTWVYKAGALLGMVAGITEMTRILIRINRENQ
jgi:F0F1-type ATP synthase assembly protein I